MLADAYEAFSIEPPKRPFEILADDDSPHTLPLGNGTVGVADEKLALGHCRKRLTNGLSHSDNRDLGRNVRQSPGRWSHRGSGNGDHGQQHSHGGRGRCERQYDQLGIQNTRAAEHGNLQEVYDRAAISLDRWLRGDPMALNAVETQLVYAQTAFMAIAEAFTNIGALVDANPGSLHPSTSGGVGTVSSTVRTWP